MSFKDYEPIDLSKSEFYIHELEGYEIDNVLNVFAGYVQRIIGRINDGKEATVYLCESDTSNSEIKHPYLAAKMYKANKFRHFETDHGYRNFAKFKDKRLAKSMRGKSNRGQKAFRNHWINTEWNYLNILYDAGVKIPKPYSHYDDGILMSCFVDDARVAPRLVDVKLSQPDVEPLLEAILDDVDTMISENIVHGDFSAYNILYNGSEHCIIDIPQAVDIRVTPDAYNLLQRDLINLGKYFARYNVEIPVNDLMIRYF